MGNNDRATIREVYELVDNMKKEIRGDIRTVRKELKQDIKELSIKVTENSSWRLKILGAVALITYLASNLVPWVLDKINTVVSAK